MIITKKMSENCEINFEWCNKYNIQCIAYIEGIIMINLMPMAGEGNITPQV